jgi:hypothetical protein
MNDAKRKELRGEDITLIRAKQNGIVQTEAVVQDLIKQSILRKGKTRVSCGVPSASSPFPLDERSKFLATLYT